MTTLKVPTVHLNGTSEQELRSQLKEAAIAVTTAMEALRHAAPHGRDYYVQSDTACNEAIKEHCARLDRLSSVYDELVEIHEAIVCRNR